ncbi:MAG: hypothetical protein JST86_09865 [Bacteroidetes bacterium]|nr:hypothetical protein [Bacteroidota bacterium]
MAQETVLKNTLVYSQNEGLSSSNIHKIIQDQYGFIWVATQDGLNRFDGKEFVRYNKIETPRHRLFSADIRDIIADTTHHIIWVICNEGGINGIDIVTGCVTYNISYTNRSLNADWRICATLLNGKIFIGTSGGLEVFNTSAAVFENSKNHFQRKAVWTINADSKGLLWLGIKDEGIFIYNPGQEQVIQQLSSQNLFNKTGNKTFWPLCSTFSGDSLYWTGTKSGLIKVTYNNKGEIVTATEMNSGIMPGLTGQQINAVTFSSQQQLIIAGSGLYFYDISSNNLKKIESANSATEKTLNDATFCFEDRQHNYWAGCKQGLITIKNSELLFTPVINSKKPNEKLSHVFAVLPVEEDRVLTGTREGLFMVEKDKVNTIYSKGLVQNLFRLTNEDILVSGNGGISLYASDHIIPVSSKYAEFRPYLHWQLNSCIQLNDSISIIGTESNDGVLIWNKKNRHIENIRQRADSNTNGPASDIVNTVYYTRDGNAVILSDYVITVYYTRNNACKNITFKSINSNNPAGVFMDMTETAHYYWVNAYGEGLLKLDKNFNLLKRFGAAAGIGNEGVYKVFNYNDSLLFITSNNGVAVFNTQTETFSHFYREDGLQGNEFEEACGALYKEFFYAGGDNGFVKINPGVLKINSATPHVYFNRLLMQHANNMLSDTTNFESTHFDIDNDVIQATLYFSGIYYEHPGRVMYSYKIREINDEWISLGNNNFIPFIGMPPGDYHVLVRAANENGAWSQPNELLITFLPKWYQTWWFYLLIALTVAAILYALYRYRIRQIKKQHEIRRSIATDLHDDLGSTLNSVKVFTNLAISGVNQNESLQQIKDNLNEATTGLRDMIWVLDDSLDTVDELITRLKQFALPVTGVSGIAFEIITQDDAGKRKLTKEEKRNLYLVCKEAVNNTIKYAEAGAIKISIAPAGKKIKITVSDNGKGFDMATAKKGYGLKNMQYRMKQVKYACRIHSVKGEGTTIEFLPQ